MGIWYRDSPKDDKPTNEDVEMFIKENYDSKKRIGESNNTPPEKKQKKDTTNKIPAQKQTTVSTGPTVPTPQKDQKKINKSQNSKPEDTEKVKVNKGKEVDLKGLEEWKHLQKYERFLKLQEPSDDQVNKKKTTKKDVPPKIKSKLIGTIQDKKDFIIRMGAVGKSAVGKSTMLTAILFDFEGDILSRKEKTPIRAGKVKVEKVSKGVTEIPVVYRYSENISIEVEYCSAKEFSERIDTLCKSKTLLEDIKKIATQFQENDKEFSDNAGKKVCQEPKSKFTGDSKEIKDFLEQVEENYGTMLVNGVETDNYKSKLQLKQIIVNFPFPGLKNKRLELIDVSFTNFIENIHILGTRY
jgi:hypothetical protein